MSNGNEITTIETSCGKTFHMAVRELSDRQLIGLVDQNPNGTDTHLLRAELQRRTKDGQLSE